MNQCDAEFNARVAVDPELRETRNGTPVTNLFLVINRGRNKPSTFVNVAVFGKTAEWVCSGAGARKGDLVQVGAVFQNIQQEGEPTQLSLTANYVQLLSFSMRRLEERIAQKYNIELIDDEEE